MFSIYSTNDTRKKFRKTLRYTRGFADFSRSFKGKRIMANTIDI